MLDFPLRTKDETLRDLLSNDKKYFVPKFQRDYSWEREQWEDLWDDMISLVNKDEPYHYMGYLVIQPYVKNGVRTSKIIDGQQRITTFSLIILAAIERLKKITNEENRIASLLSSFIGSTDLIYLKTENKIQLNRNNDYHYRQMVEGKDLPTRNITTTVRLMQQAIAYYYDKFKKYESGEGIGKIIEVISNNTFFTTIYISDDINAYKIFETLNARGVQLSSGDLLKNYIFSLIDTDNRAPKHVLNALDKQWNKIGENIGDQIYTDYILCEWNSRHALVRTSTLFREMTASIKTSASALEYLDTIERKSSCYAALHNPEDVFWREHDDHKKIKKYLIFLKVFDIKRPISLLLAVHDAMPDDFCQILKWIHAFSMRYNVICKEPHQAQEKFYNKSACLVKRDGDRHAIKETIKQKLWELYPSDEKFEQAFLNKTLPAGRLNRRARYILARLEEKIGNPAVAEEELTVEHILPTKPIDDWQKYFGKDWTSFNQRIGNMALVTAAENKKLGQKSFNVKKTVLLESAYRINKSIDYPEWAPDSITARQQQMAKTATQLWRID